MANPGLFLKAVGFLRKAGLVNKSIEKFVRQMLRDDKMRQTIYHSWLSFRNLTFDIRKLNEIAENHKTRIFLITGEYDNLLKTNQMKKLSSLLPENQKIILKTGHTRLVEKAGAWFSSIFK